ncbi:hypothetical protein ACHAQJ_000155 [Trichoderma viride]
MANDSSDGGMTALISKELYGKIKYKAADISSYVTGTQTQKWVTKAPIASNLWCVPCPVLGASVILDRVPPKIGPQAREYDAEKDHAVVLLSNVFVRDITERGAKRKYDKSIRHHDNYTLAITDPNRFLRYLEGDAEVAKKAYCEVIFEAFKMFDENHKKGNIYVSRNGLEGFVVLVK